MLLKVYVWLSALASALTCAWLFWLLTQYESEMAVGITSLLALALILHSAFAALLGWGLGAPRAGKTALAMCLVEGAALLTLVLR